MMQKTKHYLYLISMTILLFLSSLILIQSFSDHTLLDYLKKNVSDTRLTFMLFLAAGFLIGAFLLISSLLSVLTEKKQLTLTLLLILPAVILQYVLLFTMQAVVRYDHLRVFDGALEMIQTGKLSLSANTGYFGLYPFNISITAFHSLVLRVVSFLGIPEKYYMLSLQCVYLFLIDAGIFFSWKIVRLLYSVKTATLFALLCIANPILYVCAAGCYTTTLMLPLLMSTLFCLLCFLRETKFRKKCFLGFLFGVLLAFGSRIRATVLIAGIAFVIYLVIRKKGETAIVYTKKQTALLCSVVLLGGLLSFGGYTGFQNTYITEDYTNTQMPPIYYLMFATNPESRGSYNSDDFDLISQYDTLEEKEAVSLKMLKERLTDYGVSGIISLANDKLKNTWCDGTDDYRDFWLACRNYGTLHSYIAGAHKDFFVFYAHSYHIAMVAIFCLAVLAAFRKCCDASYLIFLTLLGGIVFHLLWESFYVYSFGFSMLFLIPAADIICRYSEKKYRFQAAGSTCLIALVPLIILFVPVIRGMANAQYEHTDYAVVQDMALGDCQPLTEGNVLTQTFQTDLPFNRVGCKVYNTTGTENESLYRMELLSPNGDLLAIREFTGAEAFSGDYCYMVFDDIHPSGKETFTIRLTALETSAEHVIQFGYYNTHHYDIYADGCMTGLNSDQRTDLTFQVFQKNVSGYFH